MNGKKSDEDVASCFILFLIQGTRKEREKLSFIKLLRSNSHHTDDIFLVIYSFDLKTRVILLTRYVTLKRYILPLNSFVLFISY